MCAQLALRGILKGFAGVPVLHGIDLQVGRGEVLALLGENGAGKSTLVKIIAGVEAPDAGVIEIDGTTTGALTPQDSRDHRIGYISQEITDAGSLSVAENIALGRLAHRAGLVDWPAVRRRAREALAELDMAEVIDVSVPVEQLSLGERQLVEIARAISREVTVLILDEPTAALSEYETQRLFDLLRRLRARDVAMIYITHRLDEVAQIADRVQVLRDGRTTLQAATASCDTARIVTAMVGAERSRGADAGTGGRTASRGADNDSAPLLSLSQAGVAGAFDALDLRVAAGEAVMLYGKLGSGAVEAVRAAAGDISLTSGILRVRDQVVQRATPSRLIARGVGLVALDRKAEGLFSPLSAARNLAVPSWRRLAHWSRLIRSGAERGVYGRWKEPLFLKNVASPEIEVAQLSGGNQQKILLGRWLEYGVDVLALLEPTRGVDVASRRDIYTALRGFVDGGRGVLAATSDVDEAVSCADRVLVMNRGRVVGELRGDDICAEALTRLAVT
ncbi:sugar ABC transporter ATP-binding protein [Jiangella endophytica]|uniref:sugar ABC transporter ATP-binding protein n=1 Tax=Jiangella endophytica TaxID=1623398 RepID=UPI000E346622|nr:sugar ABC transporter ATP-binding protein [Jiangella endophytica]